MLAPVPATDPDQITVMVSSTVGGQEDRLDQVRTVLRTLGYRVWMSRHHSFPINPMPGYTQLQNCLDAVDAADLVVVLIDRRYGSVSPHSAGGLSVFHEEVRRAVDTDKLRFTFVHRDVSVARKVLRPLNVAAAGAPWDVPGFAPVPGTLDDLCVLDVVDYAYKEHRPEAEQDAWVQEFPDIGSLLSMIDHQFRDVDRIRDLLP